MYEVKFLVSRKQMSHKQVCRANNQIKSILKLMSIIDRQYNSSIGITKNQSSCLSITISVNLGS